MRFVRRSSSTPAALASLASFPLYGVGEDGGLLGAEGLDAGLGLAVPAHDAEDDGGDGREQDLALVSAH